MEKFSFKYQTVLQVRRIREKEALRELGGSQKKYQEELERKSELLSSLDVAFQEREALDRKPTVATEYFSSEQFIRGLKHRIVHADQAILKARRNVEKAMRSYL